MQHFEHLRINPERPQIRQIHRAVEMLKSGGFLVMPTDTTYILVALPESADAIAAMSRLRRLDQQHMWSVLCRNLSQAATCVRISNQAHRILKRCLPGSYTFILPALSALPRRIFGKRKDVGIRMPDHPVCQMLMDELDGVLLATTLQFPDDDMPAFDPDLFLMHLKPYGCALLDVGWCGMVPTTVVDLCDGDPELLRMGSGDWPLL